MNVFFNFELDGNEHDFLKDDKLVSFFNELKQFVKQRLSVLAAEINAEELESTKMILIMIPEKGSELEGIVYAGYSKPLRDKMKNCITEDDTKYLQRRFFGMGF